MDREQFDGLTKMWKRNRIYTFEEFYQEYDELACSDWSKQDREGECYGGFYKYPEDSYERIHAYDLSRADNGKGLWELPYPKEVVMETVELGCYNRMESVNYSNFLCEWVKRKLIQWEKENTLKRLCISTIKIYNLPISKLPKDLKAYFD